MKNYNIGYREGGRFLVPNFIQKRMSGFDTYQLFSPSHLKSEYNSTSEF